MNGTGPCISPSLIDTNEIEVSQKSKSTGMVLCTLHVLESTCLCLHHHSLARLLSVLRGQAQGELCARQRRAGETAAGSQGGTEEGEGEEREGGAGGSGTEGEGGQGAGEPEEAGRGEENGEAERGGETKGGGEVARDGEERGERDQ